MTDSTVSSSSQPGPIQGIDGGQTPSSKWPLPPVLGFSSSARAPLSDVMIRKSTLLGLAGRRKACKRRYSCETCGKKFVQRQGVSRHRQEVHGNPYPCSVWGCKYTWTRPYEYGAHLEEQHPNVNPNKVLGKPRGSHCRSRILGRDRPRLSPGIEPDERSQPAYEAQPEHAEPPVATRKHEDGRRLDLFGATNAPSAFSSEACIQTVDDLAISIEGIQTRLGGSTAADSTASAITPLIPALTLPAGYCVDNMVEPSLPIYPYPFPAAEYSSYEIGINTFFTY